MTEATGLYPRLCPAWQDLDETVRRFHDNPVAARATGRFDVAEVGWLARGIARIAGFPRAGEGIPTHVEITPASGGETWSRSFGGAPLVSLQRAGDGGLLSERFGILEIRFRLGAEGGALCFDQIDAALCIGSLRIRLPKWLSPRVTARAWRDPEHEGGMRVAVELALPLVGKLFGYSGLLDLPAEAA